MNKNLKIIEFLIKQKPNTKKKLSRAKHKIARGFDIGMLNNRKILKTYRALLKNNKIKRQAWLEKVLIKRRVRTLSGVAPVAVATKPYPCPGKCIYCPNIDKMPKSYLPNQPAAARALGFKFNPYNQVQGRLKMFYDNGHCPEKVDLRILGGTWSAYPHDYQKWFIKECFRGLNQFSKQKAINNNQQSNIREKNNHYSMLYVQHNNETAKHRCVGLSIETRPDCINPAEIKRLRHYGITKVELGVQHINDKILKKIKRGHTVKQTIQATKLLKNAGFKICYHIMPNLPGSTPKKDLAVLKKLFKDQRFQPDQLKIYPCTVLKKTPLYKWYKQGKYQPYDEKTLIDLLAKIKKTIPPYVRIERIYRDVPSGNIIGGSRHTNIRQMVQKYMRKKDWKCKCIRCREIGIKYKKQNAKCKIKMQNLKLSKTKYNASDETEHFISFVNSNQKILYAFIRLRLPAKNNPDQPKPLRDCAIIRELHTYGPLAPLNLKSKLQDLKFTQHKGLGTKLLKQAEKTACTCGYSKIAVISAVGVREYYRKFGYRLENQFGYMIKDI